MTTPKLGIVVSRFNEGITSIMRKTAEEEARKLGMETLRIIEVPGAFDIPFTARRLLENKDIDCVACLGAIIKGDTDHDTLIAHVMADKLSSLSLEHDKPVSLGVIGPGATEQQAKDRAQEYAQRAVQTAKELLDLDL